MRSPHKLSAGLTEESVKPRCTNKATLIEILLFYLLFIYNKYHATNSMKRLKRPTSVFLQGDVGHVRSFLLKTWRIGETKMHVCHKFQINMSKGIRQFQDLFEVPLYWDNPSPPHDMLKVNKCQISNIMKCKMS